MVILDWLFEQLAQPKLVWLPQLTAAFFLAFRPWGQFAPVGTVAGSIGTIYSLLLISGLLVDRWSVSPYFWLLATMLHLSWLYLAYAVADNHHYLEAYWCVALAIALSQTGHSGEAAIARSAHFLIGGCFALAFVWKISNHGFRNGGFFLHSLALDDRFLPIALWIGGLDRACYESIQSAYRRLEDGQSSDEVIRFSHRLVSVAAVLTWWTLAIELLVAAAFLFPNVFDLNVRLASLVLFCITTYGLVAVPTFGHILLLMLLAGIHASEDRAVALVAACLVSLTPGALFFARRFARHALFATGRPNGFVIRPMRTTRTS